MTRAEISTFKIPAPRRVATWSGPTNSGIMSVNKTTLFQKLSDHEGDSYSFVDVLKILHECTEAPNVKEAINAWLRMKRESPEFLGHMIDACIFYHLMRVARDAGNAEHVEDFRSRMVQSWNAAVEEEDIDSIIDVDEVVLQDCSFMERP